MLWKNAMSIRKCMWTCIDSIAIKLYNRDVSFNTNFRTSTAIMQRKIVCHSDFIKITSLVNFFILSWWLYKIKVQAQKEKWMVYEHIAASSIVCLVSRKVFITWTKFRFVNIININATPAATILYLKRGRLNADYKVRGISTCIVSK